MFEIVLHLPKKSSCPIAIGRHFGFVYSLARASLMFEIFTYYICFMDESTHTHKHKQLHLNVNVIELTGLAISNISSCTTAGLYVDKFVTSFLQKQIKAFSLPPLPGSYWYFKSRETFPPLLSADWSSADI